VDWIESRRKPELRGDTAQPPHTLSHLRLAAKFLVSNLGESLKRSMHFRQLRQERSFDVIIGEQLL
jgi:hypothetical protein